MLHFHYQFVLTIIYKKRCAENYYEENFKKPLKHLKDEEVFLKNSFNKCGVVLLIDLNIKNHYVRSALLPLLQNLHDSIDVQSEHNALCFKCHLLLLQN